MCHQAVEGPTLPMGLRTLHSKEVRPHKPVRSGVAEIYDSPTNPLGLHKLLQHMRRSGSRLEIGAEQQSEGCHSAQVDGQALQHVLERQRGWRVV